MIDVRGATIGLPQAEWFYPVLPENTLVPARGFGIEVGAHVYVFRAGLARFGIGVSYVQVQGTADAVALTAKVVAPQVSINFGTSKGWSYISGGAGAAQLRGRIRESDAAGEPSQSSGTLAALNVGGGARWFMTSHVAIGFDARVHRIGAGRPDGEIPGTPASFVTAATAGFSFK